MKGSTDVYNMFNKENRVYIKSSQYVYSRADKIIELCKNKNVLHVGACDSPFTKDRYENNELLFLLINKIARSQLGIDIDKEAIYFLNDMGYSNVIYHDIYSDNTLDFDPDIIIFGETLEHLDNPGAALDSLKKYMHQNTKLVVTVPNASSLTRFRQSLLGYNMEHIDHKVAFNYIVLKQLLEYKGFRVEEMYFTQILGRSSDVKGARRILNRLYGLALNAFPILSNGLMFIVKMR